MNTEVQPIAPLTPRARWRNKLFQRSRLWSILYLLMVPTIVGKLLFIYYPNLESIKYAFYRWDGSSIEEFRGLQNFEHAFGSDPLFWNTFSLVGILLLANVLKMWPSIFVAIAIHRLANQRYQYLYRVLFVIPMVIPGLVFLLIWKTFFTEGMFNELLNTSGLMSVLTWLDSPSTGLPALHGAFQSSAYAWDGDRPIISTLLAPFRLVPLLFNSSWGLALFGTALWAANAPLPAIRQRWLPWLAICLVGALVWGPLRLLPLVVGAILIGRWLRRDRIEGPVRMRYTGLACVGLASALILLTEVWINPIGQFASGEPSWLGNSKLIIPAVIIWGFPWVGTIGVLIYLAGLQNISTEVYEAAELDGVSSFGKIFKIELPLILTQVRINLIFMTIGTLGDFGMILILLGPSGGPDNVGMVPGLYMYNKAFIQGEMGYACTLAMVMFLITLALTFMYQRFVKVEK